MSRNIKWYPFWNPIERKNLPMEIEILSDMYGISFEQICDTKEECQALCDRQNERFFGK